MAGNLGDHPAYNPKPKGRETGALIEYQLPGPTDWKRHALSQPLSGFRDESNRHRHQALSGAAHEVVVGPIQVSASLPLSEVPKDWRSLGTERIPARYHQDPQGEPVECRIGFHVNWQKGQDPARVILIGGEELESPLW